MARRGRTRGGGTKKKAESETADSVSLKSEQKDVVAESSTTETVVIKTEKITLVTGANDVKKVEKKEAILTVKEETSEIEKPGSLVNNVTDTKESESEPPIKTDVLESECSAARSRSGSGSLSPTDTSNDDSDQNSLADTGSSAKDSDALLKRPTTGERSLSEMRADNQLLCEDPEPTPAEAHSPPSPPKRGKTSHQDKQTKSKPTKNRKPKPPPPASHLITEFFDVRRSTRKPEKVIQKEKEKQLHDLILREEEIDLDIVVHPVKGRGIHAGRPFARGEFVVEYRGDLIDPKTARRREQEYANESNTGCYSYYFECNGKQWCVDATRESPYLGRLVNHSSKKPNLVTKAVAIEGTPHLILVANRSIEQGEELLYNYGDRSKEAIAANPWLVDT